MMVVVSRVFLFVVVISYQHISRTANRMCSSMRITQPWMYTHKMDS